jgi:hypothetical protein
MDIVYSNNNVPIRLTAERWLHIVENHDEVAGFYDDVLRAVEDPDYVLEGYEGALNALKEFGEGKLARCIPGSYAKGRLHHHCIFYEEAET